MNRALPAVLSSWQPNIYVYILCFPIQCATQQRNSDGTTKNLQHERYGTMSLFSCCPPPLCAGLCSGGDSSPGDPDPVPHYRPHWNIIHPSARCINNPLYTQVFFLFFMKPSCETNLLSICPVWEGVEIKFPFWGILSPAEFEIKLHSVLLLSSFFPHIDTQGHVDSPHTHTHKYTHTHTPVEVVGTSIALQPGEPVRSSKNRNQ